MKVKLTIQRMLQPWRIPLLALFFLLYATTAVEAHAQDEPAVNLNLKNVAITKIFTAIEDQTDYKFTYSKKQLSDIRIERIQFKAEKLQSVLNYLQAQAPLEFMVINKSIGVKVKPTKRSNSTGDSEAIKELIFNIPVTGKVTDAATGEPLVGATVQVKGTNVGTQTDAEGNFSLSIPENAPRLVVSYLGFATQEIAVGSQTTFMIRLQTDATAIEEVVVVGYGTQSKGSVTGAVSKLGSGKFDDFAVASIDQALAGQLAGVQIVQGSGTPGVSSNINIRGVNTLSAGTKPLLVIDGFPTENININDINPNDIESVEILKDASAAAIYGSRASRGVILITTKSGNSGHPAINFNFFTGIQQVGQRYELMDAYQLAQYQIENFQQRGGLSATPPFLQPYLDGKAGLTDTDWQDEVFTEAPIQNYQLSFAGGNDKTKYYVSADYFDQQGVIKNTDFKRYTLRTNLTTNLYDQSTSAFLKNIKLGVNLSPSYSTSDRISEIHHNADGTVLISLYAFPYFPAYNSDGSLQISQQIKSVQSVPGFGVGAFENPLAILEYRKNPLERARLYGGTYLDFELIDGLHFKTYLGLDYASERESLFRPSNIGLRNSAAPTTATANSSTNRILNWISENTLSYNKEFVGGHSIALLGGYTFQKENIQNNFLSGQNFPTDVVTTLSGATQLTGGTSREEKWSLLSYLGRFSYGYEGKYLLTASVRRDGSSRFGANSKWGWFPSASVGWRVSEEPFFEKIKEKISDLKLRVSYGNTGNNQIPNYGSIALLSTANYAAGNTLLPGLAPSTSPNSNLSWESTVMSNIGLDAGFFKNRIFLTLDAYRSTTNDLLLNVPVPSSSGYTASLQNFGKIRNQGVELTLSANEVKLGPISWNASFNISANQNEVLELGPNQNSIVSKLHITNVGERVGQFYGWNIIGVFNSQEELDKTPHPAGDKLGDYIWEDANKDGKIDAGDRKVLGSVFPDFTYGFSSSFSFKGIDLSFLLQGTQGGELLNFTNYFLSRRGDFTNGLAERFTGRWVSTAQPGTGYARAGANEQFYDRSSYLIEDASYLRIRNITLGYTLPQGLTEKIRIQRARIYFAAINPFTFTNYSGYNPESNATIGGPGLEADGSPLQPGIDWGNYPLAKNFTVGLNVSFK